MSKTSFDQLLQTDNHFGHLRRKWNPAIAPYIFMERNGTHIIDLNKTVAKIDEAAEALRRTTKSGRKVLFVATRKQTKDIVAEKAASVNMPYVDGRWADGILTNLPTTHKTVKKVTNIDKLVADGMFENISKRKLLQVTHQRARLEKSLGSITDLTRSPSALFIVSACKEHIAVKETNRLNIPVFAIVNTNSDPKNIDFVISASDDTEDSVGVILTACCQAIAGGLEERKTERVDEKATAEQQEEAAEAKPEHARKACKQIEEAEKTEGTEEVAEKAEPVGEKDKETETKEEAPAAE